MYQFHCIEFSCVDIHAFFHDGEVPVAQGVASCDIFAFELLVVLYVGGERGVVQLCGPGHAVVVCSCVCHCTSLHYTTLHYTTLHCTTPHAIYTVAGRTARRRGSRHVVPARFLRAVLSVIILCPVYIVWCCVVLGRALCGGLAGWSRAGGLQ